MKKKSLKTTPSSAEPLSPIHAKEYAALSREARLAYRPVNSKYEKLPRFCLWLYGLALFSLVIYVALSVSPTFADFFNQHISSVGHSF